MLISILVKLNKTRVGVEKNENGSYTIFTKAKAVDGKANEDIIKQLSIYLKIPKSSILIKSGIASRRKIIEVGV